MEVRIAYWGGSGLKIRSVGQWFSGSVTLHVPVSGDYFLHSRSMSSSSSSSVDDDDDDENNVIET